MEHRLCHQHGGPGMNNAPGAGPSFAPMTREEAEAAYREQIDRLRTKTTQTEIDKGLLAAANDPALFEEVVRMRTTTLKDRSRELSEEFSIELSDAQKGIAESLVGKERAEVLAMISALTKPLPPQKANVPHRYGNSDTGLNFTQIERDQRFIRSILPGFPQAAEYLNRIDGALTRLTQQDIRYELREYERSRSSNKADKLVGELSQMGGFLVMVAGALLTGIPAIMHSIKNGKFELKHYTPFLLYASVAGLIASPSLRRQLFAGNEQNTLTEIDTTLNNPKFRSICEDYHVDGPAWARSVQTMMDQPAETNKLVATLRSKRLNTNGIEAEVETYVKKAATTPEQRANLLRMINDGRFVDFVQILRMATTKDAKGVILDYIRVGAKPFVAQAQGTANQINAATGGR